MQQGWWPATGSVLQLACEHLPKQDTKGVDVTCLDELTCRAADLTLLNLVDAARRTQPAQRSLQLAGAEADSALSAPCFCQLLYPSCDATLTTLRRWPKVKLQASAAGQT